MPLKTTSVKSIACVLALMACATTTSLAAEIVQLTPENWNLVPGGKEVDAIYGDYLLRNDKVVAVIASDAPKRSANLRITNCQGALLDLSLIETSNDQLTAFLPHAYASSSTAANAPPQTATGKVEIVTARGEEVRLRATRPADKGNPVEIVTEYALRDAAQHITVTTRRKNTSDKPASVRLTERIVCDRPFSQMSRGSHDLVWYDDRWFGAAYGVIRAGDGEKVYIAQQPAPLQKGGAGILDYPDLGERTDGPNSVIRSGAEVVLTRHLIAGKDAGDVQRVAATLRKLPVRTLIVRPTDGKRGAAAHVEARQGEQVVSAARSDGKSAASLSLAPGKYKLAVSAPGRKLVETEIEVDDKTPESVDVEIGAASEVVLSVTDGKGNPSPFKVQFLGVGATPNPDLGPVERSNGCMNLYFSTTGTVAVALPPGQYYAIISRGPEYDAAYTTFILGTGQTVKRSVRLPKVVDTTGWISADFHNHSTDSGDNSTEMESRIACLIAEGLDFAACTEHQRITTYRDKMKKMGVLELMATSDGMELTGTPLPLNHQNAFPLVPKPNTQNGGGPFNDKNPRVQIKSLKDHDGGAEKLVQQNHPDIGWLIYDKDGDGKPDEGFGTLEFTDVIEMFTDNLLDMKAMRPAGGDSRNDRAFNWLQLLNQGHRIPGVGNTDAHTCFHESGAWRTWVKSPTDDATKIQEMDVVRAARKGQMVISTGPYLEVSLNGQAPGGDVALGNGSSQATLKIKVQCPNWFDVDRVQVLVNGRPEPALNFTRAKNADRFGEGVVKFEAALDLKLDRDAHVIVVTAQENGTTGPVMGMGKRPFALSNPIYVDVDGGGFQANKDTLGAPLPVKAQ